MNVQTLFCCGVTICIWISFIPKIIAAVKEVPTGEAILLLLLFTWLVWGIREIRKPQPVGVGVSLDPDEVKAKIAQLGE